MGNVVPLFKKDCKIITGHYGSVSLTSVVGKILERIPWDNIYMHLERQEWMRMVRFVL